MRKVEEWVGKHPDQKVPPHVKLRIFEREKGVCHLSGRRIRPGDLWDLDHKKALCNGGEHRETNLFPALRDKHKEKTKEDVAEKSDIYEKRAKHLGINLKPKYKWPKRPMNWRARNSGREERNGR